MTDYSKIFGTSKLFELRSFKWGEKADCSICNREISPDKKVCEPDCSYYVSYKTKTIEIFKKHSITYEDISTKESETHIIGGGYFFSLAPKPATSSQESRDKVIDILYKEGLKMCSSNDLRKKILLHKIKWAINSGHYDYGFLLMDPFSISEIEEFETKFAELHSMDSFKLPPELRKYLLEVSREIFIFSYPVFFYLMQKYKHQDDDDDNNDDNNDDDDFKDNTLIYKIGEGGCSFSYQINILTGNIYSCDGNRNYKRGSFDEMVLDKLRF